MTQAELATQLEDHPLLTAGMSALLLLAAGSLVSLLMWLAMRQKRDQLNWNHLRPLTIPTTEVLAFFLLLVLLLITPTTTLLVIPLAMAGVVWLTLQSRVSLVEQWGLRRYPLVRVASLSLWICFAAMAVLMPLSSLLDSSLRALGFEPVLQGPVEQFLQAKDSGDLLILLFLATIVAPITEEFLFRGFLQPLLKKRLGAWGALILTAAIFSFIHFHPYSFLQILLLGIIMGAAYEATGSLLVSIGIHAAFNTLQATLLLSLRPFLS